MDNDLLEARLRDTAEICERTSRPKFLGFLTRDERAAAEHILKNTDCHTEYFGGYEGAERVFLGCFPYESSKYSFPVTAITFCFRKNDALSHRDFLGALMSLGIGRETVGDILTEPGRAVVFVADEIKKFVVTQIGKIGNVGVTVKEGYDLPLPEGDRLAEFSATAASDRLDCVIAAVCGISRAKACEKIENGAVTVNSAPALKQTKTVCGGDVISVRGSGRFILDSLEDRTKKNRLIIKYKRYV